MLEDLLKFDKLGNKEELHFLLFKALPLSEVQKIDDLRTYSSSCVFTIGRSFYGMLKLLECITFINIEGDAVTLNKKVFNPLKYPFSHNYFDQPNFISAILTFVNKEAAIPYLFNEDGIKYIDIHNTFYLKENLIPYKFFPIRNLLLSIGFLERDGLNSNHLLVTNPFIDCFRTIVIKELQTNAEKRSKRRFTYEQLQNRLAINERYGLEAEVFVEAFEKKRLQGHFLANKVKRISEEFVNAGYDIESFENTESVLIDRFIEVKSFSDDVSFYWSKGEVNTAKDYGDKYYLYLVDRNKINDENYNPSIFQNPYQKIFENEYWKKEIQNWKITLE
jgi:hypothetical protein